VGITATGILPEGDVCGPPPRTADRVGRLRPIVAERVASAVSGPQPRRALRHRLAARVAWRRYRRSLAWLNTDSGQKGH